MDQRARFLALVEQNPVNRCFGVSRAQDGDLIDYAPHGYTDLFAKRVRPNPRLAPREVYEKKARRWLREWPDLIVDPWPTPRDDLDPARSIAR